MAYSKSQRQNLLIGRVTYAFLGLSHRKSRMRGPVLEFKLTTSLYTITKPCRLELQSLGRFVEPCLQNRYDFSDKAAFHRKLIAGYDARIADLFLGEKL